MNTEELFEYDDLGDALREGRALRLPRRGGIASSSRRATSTSSPAG